MVGAELDSGLSQDEFKQWDGAIVPAGASVGCGEVIAARNRSWVIGTKLRFPLLGSRLDQRDRLGNSANVRQCEGKMSGLGRWGDGRNELRLSQLERISEVSEGLVEAAGGAGSRGEAVAAIERIAVISAELRLPHLKGRLVHPNRLESPAHFLVGTGEVVAADEGVAMIGPEPRLPQLERGLTRRNCLDGAACRKR